ncbi:hypothetical protein LXL04_020743 [Taraxacum kok-saghyz]
MEEQIGIRQIQFSSHGGDIREMKKKMDTVLQGKEEMRQTNKELSSHLVRLLKRIDGGGARTPNSDLVTPTGIVIHKYKGMEGSTIDLSSSGAGNTNRGGPGLIKPRFLFQTGGSGFILETNNNPPGGDKNAGEYKGTGEHKGTNENKGIGEHRGNDGNRGGGRYKYRHRKIDMPSFNGTNPDGGDFCEQWAALEQTGTMEEYIRRYVELAAPLEGVSEQIALGNFIKGLKPTIRNELRIWALEDFGRAMDLAQQIEEKNRSLRTSGFGALGYQGSIQTTQIRSLPTNPISQNTEEEELDPIIEEIEDEPAVLEHTEVQPEVTLNSCGLTSLQTMRLRGEIMNRPVVTLIDPVANHNFISEGLVKSLGLHVNETPPYGVRMGTGDSEPSQGICEGVLLYLEPIEIGVKLKGDRTLGRSLISLKSLYKELRNDGEGILVEFCEAERDGTKPKPIPSFIKHVLTSIPTSLWHLPAYRPKGA